MNDMVPNDPVLGAAFAAHGISRRSVLKFCAALATAMALPPGVAPAMAQALVRARRPSVIWLSMQECTGCSESLLRSSSPTLEGLIFDSISLDYHHLLQAASGEAAEKARTDAMRDAAGKYILVVDGSIPLKEGGAYSTIGGVSNVDLLQQVAKDAAVIIAVGTCASYGGIPQARPNPTGAVGVADLIKNKPIINVPGCPPIGLVMSGVLVHYLTFGTVPELDPLGRPKAFYGETVHDRCYRRGFYDEGKFAKTFDDEGARQGWCLYELGCKGPTTYNSCAVMKWNGGTSFPIQSGHGCLGCSQPGFWDAGSFYQGLPTGSWGGPLVVGGAAAVGAAAGLAAGLLARHRQARAEGEG